jgi:hypothetical protein
MSKGGIAALCLLYFKMIEYLTSTFDIHYSIFDIRFFRVSFPIKLAALQASGCVDPPPAEHLTPDT